MSKNSLKAVRLRFCYIGGFILTVLSTYFMWGQLKNVPYELADRIPSISFTLHEPGIEMGNRFSDSPKIVNQGKVSAISISVRFRMKRDDEYCPWITCFDLQGEEKQELFWMRFPDTIQAAYCDRTGTHFMLTIFQDGKPIHSPITENDFRGIDAEAMANRFKNNAHLRHSFLQFIQQNLNEKNNDIDAAIREYGQFEAIRLFYCRHGLRNGMFLLNYMRPKRQL